MIFSFECMWFETIRGLESFNFIECVTTLPKNQTKQNTTFLCPLPSLLVPCDDRKISYNLLLILSFTLTQKENFSPSLDSSFIGKNSICTVDRSDLTFDRHMEYYACVHYYRNHLFASKYCT